MLNGGSSPCVYGQDRWLGLEVVNLRVHVFWSGQVKAGWVGCVREIAGLG